MSQILYPPAKAQTIGEVLRTGAQIFRLSLNATLPYAIIVALCGELANLRNLSEDLPLPSFDSVDPIWLAWKVAGTILALLFGSALILKQKALAAGERTSAMAEMRQAALLLSQLIACVALSTVVVIVALLPVGAVLPMTGLNPAMTNMASVNVGMLLALIPLSLPGAYVSLGLLFAPTLLVLRKLGPLAAMGGSFRLLRGNWWRTSVLSGALTAVLGVTVLLVATVAAAAVLISGVSDLKLVAPLAIPLDILSSALLVPWCGAQILAMLGDLTVRQNESRRSADGAGDGKGGTHSGPAA